MPTCLICKHVGKLDLQAHFQPLLGSAMGRFGCRHFGRSDPTRRVWIDIFALRQWPEKYKVFSFAQVVSKCNSFVLVCSDADEHYKSIAVDLDVDEVFPPPVRKNLSFFRVWCLVELSEAHMQKYDNDMAVIFKIGSYRLNRNGEAAFKFNYNMATNLFPLIDIDNAEATVPEDKERILNEIARSWGIERLNQELRGMASSSLNCNESILQWAACSDEHALRHVLDGDAETLVKYLILAAGGGHLPLVAKLVEKGVDVNGRSSAVRSSGRGTALMLAARCGREDIMELLIDNGAAVDFQDDHGLTALMYAAMIGSKDCINFLLHRGAKLELLDCSNLSVLYYARYMHHFDLSQYLMDIMDEDFLFSAAAYHGHD